MQKRDLFSLCVFYAISPIHAGAGSSLAAVDLPIQRERHTNWPHIQASAVKGAMRAHYRDFAENTSLINYLFGSDEQDGWKDKENIPGAVSVSDAKLLAFPVRSSVAPFVWVTCPAVLARLKRDLTFSGMEGIAQYPLPVAAEEAFCLAGQLPAEVLLEDMVVAVKQTIPNPLPPPSPHWISSYSYPTMLSNTWLSLVRRFKRRSRSTPKRGQLKTIRYGIRNFFPPIRSSTVSFITVGPFSITLFRPTQCGVTLRM